MYTFLIVLFVILSFLLIVVILLQAGKGAGLAGAIGGGMAGQSVFGGRGAGDFLSKTTTYIAMLYMALALVIGMIYKNSAEEAQQSLIQREAESQQSIPASTLPVAPIENFDNSTPAVPAEETTTEDKNQQ